MDTRTTDLLRALETQRVLPVLRGALESARSLARAVLSAGATVVELTTTVEDYERLTVELRREFPDAWIGVGTIRSKGDASRAWDCGASFLVSPHPVPGVREMAQTAGLPFIEGGLTPGELAAGSTGGIVKLFPAHLGGTKYLKSVQTVLPEVRIVPTGGIELADIEAWLAAGAVAVGIGSGFPADTAELDRLFRPSASEGTA